MKMSGALAEMYGEGTKQLSVTISMSAWELIVENEISNVSRFVNEVIVEALQDKSFWKRKEMKSINAAKERLMKLGLDVELSVREPSDPKDPLAAIGRV